MACGTTLAMEDGGSSLFENNKYRAGAMPAAMEIP
jgi:hypothetical protein